MAIVPSSRSDCRRYVCGTTYVRQPASGVGYVDSLARVKRMPTSRTDSGVFCQFVPQSLAARTDNRDIKFLVEIPPMYDRGSPQDRCRTGDSRRLQEPTPIYAG